MKWPWQKRTRKRTPRRNVPAPLLWEKLRKKGDPKWYPAYLRSQHWRRFRKQRIEQAGFRCSRCGYEDKNRDAKRGTRLHVHHVSYMRVGAEWNDDVVVLCVKCHKRAHGR